MTFFLKINNAMKRVKNKDKIAFRLLEVVGRSMHRSRIRPQTLYIGKMIGLYISNEEIGYLGIGDIFHDIAKQ